MKLAARLLLAGALAASFAVTAVPATANDCSNPKNPCGGCTVNREVLDDLRDGVHASDVVRCYPV